METRGRRPVSIAPKNRKLIWSVIRALKTFTVKDIYYKTDINQRTITCYLQNLEKAEIVIKELETIGKGCLKTSRYTLIKDVGVVAPVVNKAGVLIENTNQGRIWRAIRILKIFSLKDVVATASTEEDPISVVSADNYLSFLKKAGYLNMNKDKVYRLNPAMNKGIQAPQIQRIRQIYDPNTDEVVWNSVEG